MADENDRLWSTPAGIAAGPHLGTENRRLSGHKGSTAAGSLWDKPVAPSRHLERQVLSNTRHSALAELAPRAVTATGACSTSRLRPHPIHLKAILPRLEADIQIRWGLDLAG
ncbi:hypothetical protein SPHV1_2170054 [Novosphingobium sp. KN65.2]|nr:hypothetical protein SPHV1_2170054 [Novosphingobium sp. KN65.2]